jgi:hypothetical protein
MHDIVIDCSFYKTLEKAQKALASKQYNEIRFKVVIQEMEGPIWAIIPAKHAGTKHEFVRQ